MSDTVALALIGMFRSWGEMFVQHLAVIVPAVGSAVVGYMTWRNNQRSERRTRSLLEEVESVKQVAKLSDEQAALIAKGAERAGFEGGIRTERMRASDIGKLQASFQPESTDVFMRRTDGTDTDDKR